MAAQSRMVTFRIHRRVAPTAPARQDLVVVNWEAKVQRQQDSPDSMPHNQLRGWRIGMKHRGWTAIAPAPGGRWEDPEASTTTQQTNPIPHHAQAPSHAAPEQTVKVSSECALGEQQGNKR
jgi:hypothetical protein